MHSWASSKAPLLFWWTQTEQAAKCQGSRFVWTIFEKPKSRAASFKWQSSKTSCLEPPKLASIENDAAVRVLHESGFSDASFCYASLLLASVLTHTTASILKDPFKRLGAARIYSRCARSALKPLKPLLLKAFVAIAGWPGPTQRVTPSRPLSGSSTRRCGLRSQLVVGFSIKVYCEGQGNHPSEIWGRLVFLAACLNRLRETVSHLGPQFRLASALWTEN